MSDPNAPDPDSPTALTTPQPKQPASGATVDAQAATFEWLPAPAAEGYLIQIAADSDFEELVFDAPVRGRPSFTLRGMLPEDADTLYWRVRATTDAGDFSDWSEPRPFIVVGDDASDPAEASEAPAAEAEAPTPDADGSPYLHAHTSSREVMIGVLVALISFIITLLVVAFFALDMTAL